MQHHVKVQSKWKKICLVAELGRGKTLHPHCLGGGGAIKNSKFRLAEFVIKTPKLKQNTVCFMKRRK